MDGRSEPPLLRPVWLLVHQDLRGSTRVKLVSAAVVDAFRRNAKILRDGQRPPKQHDARADELIE